MILAGYVAVQHVSEGGNNKDHPSENLSIGKVGEKEKYEEWDHDYAQRGEFIR